MRNLKITETRILGHERLRRLCVDFEWCNSVDADTYNDLLTFADKKNITTDDIVYIAEKIDEYTSENDYNGNITAICFEVARGCLSLFSGQGEEQGDE